MKRSRGGLAITKIASVGHDADVKIGGDFRRERPFQRADDFIQDLRRGGRVGIDQIERGVAGITDVMIDIHIRFALPLVEGRAETLGVGAIDGDDDAIGFGCGGEGSLERRAARKKFKERRQAVCIGDDDILAHGLESECETERRAIGIAIGTHVGDDEESVVLGTELLERERVNRGKAWSKWKRYQLSKIEAPFQGLVLSDR